MTKTATKRLRPGFGARVRTTDTQVMATAFGGVERPVLVTLNGGDELPENVAPGEYERLDALGAFTPVASRAARGIVEATPQHVLNATAPEGRAVATPSGIVVPTDEQASAQERLAQAQADVRKAFDETQADDAVPVDVETVPSAAVEGDAVAPDADAKPSKARGK